MTITTSSMYLKSRDGLFSTQRPNLVSFFFLDKKREGQREGNEKILSWNGKRTHTNRSVKVSFILVLLDVTVLDYPCSFQRECRWTKRKIETLSHSLSRVMTKNLVTDIVERVKRTTRHFIPSILNYPFFSRMLETVKVNWGDEIHEWKKDLLFSSEWIFRLMEMMISQSSLQAEEKS